MPEIKEALGAGQKTQAFATTNALREAQLHIPELTTAHSSLEPTEHGDVMLAQRVFFVGLRYGHHARNSGYESFGRYVGTALEPPVNFRWTLGRYGWPLSKLFARVTRHPWYSIGAHLTEWDALRHMARKRNCLYHVLYADSDLWLLRRAHRVTGNHLVASFHQPTSDLRKLGVVPRIARHLDGVVLLCRAQQPYFEEFLPPERIFIVPHGVNTTFFAPPPEPPPDPVCITVGSHLRDFDTLRDVIRLIWKEQPNMRFIAVGTRSDRKSLFPPLDDERAQFLDRISDERLLSVYQSAQLALFAFKEATANNAMLEAMATGLPVVATNLGGIGEYVTPGTGVLCPPGSPEALATAALGILNDPIRRSAMSRAAREQAVALDFRRVADRISRIYAGLLMRDS